MPLPITPIRNFNSGLNTEVSNYLMPDTQVTEAINVHFDEIGNVTRRLGIATLGNQMTASNSILGLYNFISSDSSNNQVLAVCSDGANNNIYYLSGATWTQTLGTDTVDLKTRFATFLDRVVRVNGTDAVRAWSGTGAWESSGGPIDVADAPVGKFIETLKARLYIAGTSTYPDRLYFSSLPSSAGVISWTTASDYLDISPNDGDNITALKRYATHLLIFKKNYLYRWNGSAVEPDPIINVGTHSQESVVEGKGGVYFHHPKGIFVYAGGYPKEISKPIDGWIRAISSANYADVNAATDSDHVYFFVGDVTKDSVAHTNMCLRFTISSQVWTVYSYVDEIKVGAQYVSGTDVTQIVGGSDGYVYTLNSGNSDNGTAIEFSLVTKYFEFGSLAHEFIITEVAAYLKQGAGSFLKYQVDDSSEWKDIGQIKEYVNVFSKDVNISGKRARFKLMGMSITAPCVFEGLEVLKGTRDKVSDQKDIPN